MAKFVFEARGPGGRDFRGEIEAASEAEARVKLRAQRLMPTRISTQTVVAVKKKGGAKISSKDLQIFTRQLATLLSSGVPIMQAMETLADGSRSPGLVTALNDIAEEVSKGKRFGEALANHPKVFDRFYVNMVVAGEESGEGKKCRGRWRKQGSCSDAAGSRLRP